MKKLLLSLLFGILGVGVYGQTIKSLGYNTTNGQVIYSGTNTLTFTNPVVVGDILISNSFVAYNNGAASIDLEEAQLEILGSPVFQWADVQLTASVPLAFNNTSNAATTRTNLGLGAADNVTFESVTVSDVFAGAIEVGAGGGNYIKYRGDKIEFIGPDAAINAATTRTNLGLGATWLTNTNVTNFRTAIGLGWSALTNSNAANFRTAIGLGDTDVAYFQEVGVGANNYTMSGISTNISTNRGFHFKQSGIPFLTISNLLGTNGGALIFHGAAGAATTRTNLGLGWPALTNSNASVGLLGYQTNGIVQYAASGTTPLIFSNTLGNDSRIRLISQITDDQLNLSVNTISYNGSMGNNFIQLDELKFVASDNASWTFFGPISFNNTTNSVATRANLGFSTNLNSFWTATNTSDARSAIGLGTTNTVAFSNVVNNGDFTNNNGTIYGLKTNVGPFEGVGNFFASNNTTVGNETLFRVGVAETTNKSAQFGFRVARTNNGGEGLAVFSVFGYNALMMIGPSDRSRSNSLTNTNAAIEADIWTMSETNRVMTLRDTNTGATVMHRPIGFNTNEVSTTAPSNTTVTNPTGWIQIYVGTNSVRVPYYQ